MAKKLSVTPLHDRVIVKAAAAEEKTCWRNHYP
jgi:co-chaperonin GroES (HSP10)